MSDFKDYVDAHNDAITTSGSKPNLLGYFVVKASDGFSTLLSGLGKNLFVIILVVFTLLFTYLALFSPGIPEEGKKWLMNLVSLCLGVFLGLFRNRRV